MLLRIGKRQIVEILTLSCHQESILVSTWSIEGWPADVALPKPGKVLSVPNKHGTSALEIVVDHARRWKNRVLVVERRRGKYVMAEE